MAVAFAIGAAGLLAGTGISVRSARATAPNPAVAAPAYFWSQTQWDRMLVGSSDLRYVVLNPDSGPGTQPFSNFVANVAAARSQGATVIGYVDTTYGDRPLTAVKADIDRYRAWYGVNGFFFDQTPYDCARTPYYEELKTHVGAQAGALIFHNPGMNPQECYLDVADVVVNFEGSASTYTGWTPASYVTNYPASRFWHIVYDVAPSAGPATLSTAAGRNAGLVYLTEQQMPNPFAVIPTDSLWSAQTPNRGRRGAPQTGTPGSSTIPSGRVDAPQSATPTTQPAPPTTQPAPPTTQPAPPPDAPVTTHPAAPSADPSSTTLAPPVGGALAGVASPAPVVPPALPAPAQAAPSIGVPISVPAGAFVETPAIPSPTTLPLSPTSPASPAATTPVLAQAATQSPPVTTVVPPTVTTVQAPMTVAPRSANRAVVQSLVVTPVLRPVSPSVPAQLQERTVLRTAPRVQRSVDAKTTKKAVSVKTAKRRVSPDASDRKTHRPTIVPQRS